MNIRTRAAVVAVGAIGVGSIGLAGVGIAFASAKHSGDIHGCVAKSDGALRVVSSSHDCSGKESALSFNSHGPRGRRGARGLRGLPGDSGTSPATFQMYANVDAEGHLGSNVDAVSVTNVPNEPGVYDVIFTKPIGSCAASAQPGEAGGTDEPFEYSSAAKFVAGNPDEWQVSFFDAFSNEFARTPFMLTVTCPT